ncbi:uncharacterized protein LOC123011304 [Tribolium madens]|uniref:uncharacterized protein LOC123011304 n=1 Tax=Tribolium madens TaxID=41895 RepID=UPI001CF73695|nr:uncharacterized protein LOC123011304 [Tribolium madens]
MQIVAICLFSILFLNGVLCQIECKSSGITCPDPYTFQFCANITDKVLVYGTPTKCPLGTICDNEGFFACKVGTLPTTTPSPTTVFACNGPAKFPTAVCNQYLECVLNFFIWAPVTNTCPKGQNFDPALNECSENYSCGPDAITVEPPVEPKCNGAGKFPGPTPNQYYECEFIWFQFQPTLKSCLEGQIFDVTVSLCVQIPLTDDESASTKQSVK